MRAISVLPEKLNSVHLAEMPKPALDQVPSGRGMLVKVPRVGVEGTDKEKRWDSMEYQGRSPWLVSSGATRINACSAVAKRGIRNGRQ